jgi:hypothetical protein
MESAFRNNWTRLLLAVVVLGLCVGASAQVSKGSISGTVVDASGAIIGGAEVKATSQETNQSITTTSDNSGLFKLPLLPVGSYRVEVSREGFRKAFLTGVGVTPGVDTGLGIIKLEIGSVAETVEVTAATPLIETTQAQITATFDQTYLDNIPGIQENQGLDELAILLPGVSASRDSNRANTNGVGFTVDGLRGRSNDQQIDGQNNNDNSVTGPGIFVGDTEFVNQYQVVTGNFGAEYGRNSGSVVNVTTKSGTNTWHGSVYGTESNSVLTTLTNQQKNPLFGTPLTKPPRFNDEFTGATIGGPWVKNKIFFFGGFDNEIISSKNDYFSSGATPTPTGVAQLAGCFPGSTSIAALQAYGPYAIGTGNPTPSGVSTKDYNDAGITVPVPNDGGTGCNVELGGVQRTLNNGSHQYNWVSRLDINGNGGKDNVYARYIFQKLTFFNADSFGLAAMGYPVNVPSLGQALGLSWTHKISDRMLNEARGSIGRESVQFGGNTLGNTIPTDSGVLGALSSIGMGSGLQGFGVPANAPQGRNVNTIQAQDNWSYVRGRHQFKAGVNYTYQKSPNVFPTNQNGTFSFKDWETFAKNAPSNTNVTLGPPKLDFIEHDSFFYFGDDWKISNHLTLNLGLTYSYYGQPANLFHNNDVKQQTGSNPFWDPTLPLSLTTFPSIPAPKNSWGPNIGFAYAVGNGGWLFGQDKTVFRGGYRLAYDPPFYNIYLNIATSSPQVLAATITPTYDGTGACMTNCTPLPAQPFGPAIRSQLASYLTTGVFDPRRFNQTAITNNFKPDRVHSWSFGIQRELTSHAAFEARYVGNHALDQFQSINGNPYVGCGDGIDPSTGLCNANAFEGEYLPGLADGIAAGVFKSSLLPAGVTPCPSASATVAKEVGRANCNLGVQRLRTNTSYSDYNGLQMEFRTTNLFNQLTMKTNYTWSKATDNTSEIFGSLAGSNTVAFSQDPFNNLSAEHGLSGNDFPNTWTLSFNETLPFFKNQPGVIGHILGGWSFAGSYILQSGQPYTPVEATLVNPLYVGNAAGYNVSDSSFESGFNSTYDTKRPFISNPSAPATSIGVYAADGCFEWGNPTMCADSPTALYDWTALNGSLGATATPVTAKQEHFILNAPEAWVVNGTPYGNAARNILRDFKTNTANFQIAKTSNWGERVRLIWHMSMVNAFNHANYASIDPFLDDAGQSGLFGPGVGFGNPYVQNGGNRTIRFGFKVTF